MIVISIFTPNPQSWSGSATCDILHGYFWCFFGQKISKTLKICCAGFIGFRGVTDPQVMFQLFVWDHFSPLLMSQTQVFAPRRYLLVLVCVHRVYPLSSGCHRGPKGQKIDFFTLVWNCSGMVKMAQKHQKGPKYGFADTTVLQVYTRAAPPCVHCGYRGRIFALIPSFIGSERASNGVWALARIRHLFGVFLGHYYHPRAIPDQSGKIDFLTSGTPMTPI